MSVADYTSANTDPLIRLSKQTPDNFPAAGTINQRIQQVVTSRFDASEQHLRGRFERFYRYEKLISMISKRKSFDWKANAFLPYALSAAESAAAMKFLSLMGGRPHVAVQATRPTLDSVADHREAQLDWRFRGDINLIETLAQMLRISERYGKSVALITPEWDHKILRFRERVNLPTSYGPLARLEWKTTRERAYHIKCETMDNTDLFIQPGFRRINGVGGMRWCERRLWLTIDELRGLEQDGLVGAEVGGQPVSDIKDTSTNEMNEFKAKRLFMDKYDELEQYRDQFDRTAEIIEYQGIVPDELIDPELARGEINAGLDPKLRILGLANRKVVVYNQALPWDHGMKSYIEMSSTPNPYDFFGVGKIEPIEHLVYVGNEIMNMRLDNVKAAINGIIGVDGTAMPAGWKRRLMSQPWGVVETNRPPGEVIQRLQLGDVTASSYHEQQQVFSLIQEATAINETMLGSYGGPVRTLGEQEMKEQSGSRRINFELATQSNEFFGPYRRAPGIVYFIINLDRQYLPIPSYVQVVNPDSPDDMMQVNLTYEDLAADEELFVYQVTGALEGVNRQAKRMEFNQFMQAIAPFVPLLMQAGFNAVEFIKADMRLYDMDPERFFPRIPPQMLQPGAPGQVPVGPVPQGTQGGPQRPDQRARRPQSTSPIPIMPGFMGAAAQQMGGGYGAGAPRPAA